MLNIGNYVTARNHLLGEGGFGRVYRGHREGNVQHTVAIKEIDRKKVIRASGSRVSSRCSDLDSMLKNEIEIMRSLQKTGNVNILLLLESQWLGQVLYIVLPFCDSKTLLDFIAYGSKQMAEADVKHLASQIANGCNSLLDLKIVHNDLKPENLLLHKTVPGAGGMFANHVVKIADFGLSKVIPSCGYLIGDCRGTLRYISPENLLKKPYDHRSDIWAIGTILFICFFLKTPFSVQDNSHNPDGVAGTMEFYKRNSGDPVIFPGNIENGDLQDILKHMLQVSAEDRLKMENFSKHPFLRCVTSDISKSGDKTIDSSVSREQEFSNDFTRSEKTIILSSSDERSDEREISRLVSKTVSASVGSVPESVLREQESGNENNSDSRRTIVTAKPPEQGNRQQIKIRLMDLGIRNSAAIRKNGVHLFVCPVCGKTTKCGLKQRVMRHIARIHSDHESQKPREVEITEFLKVERARVGAPKKGSAKRDTVFAEGIN